MADKKARDQGRVKEYRADDLRIDPDTPLHGETPGVYTPGTDQGGEVPGGVSAAGLGGGGTAGDIDRPDSTGRGTTDDVTRREGGGSYPRGLATEGIKSYGKEKDTSKGQKGGQG